MARAVSRLPDFRRDKLSSIYCDSVAAEFHAKTEITDPGALADLCWALAAELAAAFGHHPCLTAYGPSSAVWVSFPAIPRFDHVTNKMIRDDRGKLDYSNGTILKWADRVSGDRFKHSVIAAVVAEHGAAAIEPVVS